MGTLLHNPTPPDPLTPPAGEYIPHEQVGLQQHLANVRALATLLDSAVTIPGTGIKIGLDALLGLIPVVGDLSTMLVGGYTLATAARLGVPKAVLARMLLNIGGDALAGSVPVVGDLLDVAWRSNARNADLLEQAVADPERAGRSSWWVVAGVIAAVVAITAAGIALTVALARLVWDAVG